MAKDKKVYICNSCGYESLKWMGKCPQCEEWQTFEETTRHKQEKAVSAREFTGTVQYLGDSLSKGFSERLNFGIGEFDRVLGGGIVRESAVLLGGDPGIGKSTLVLQAAAGLKEKTLYVTGEESLQQINLRASRLGIKNENIALLAETDVEVIAGAIEKENPSVVIIDSVQTVSHSGFDNSPGTVNQIRECTVYLMDVIRKAGCALILIGHVTKEGYIAGPKVLEHIVDAVLQFEGERNSSYRILRAQKNRFGSTNEIGIFEMQEGGLKEVLNPSELFLNIHENPVSGSVITSSMEGTRPIMLEVQALAVPSYYGNPQRVATGFDYRRLSILLAVLEKRAEYKVSSFNIFVNMSGGIRIDEPAADLAVCCAVASSVKDRPVDTGIALMGEVGLGGEVRSISHVEKRIAEARKLDFTTIVIPKKNYLSLSDKKNKDLLPVANLNDVLKIVLK